MADFLCSAYEKGDSPYYLAEYNREVSAYLDISALWEVYGYLDAMVKLEAKRKLVANAYKKIGKLTPALEKRLGLVTDTHVLDDILIPLRPNPRSKGQLAARKGIDELADLIAAQTEEVTPIEELAASYVGKDPSLKTTADVIQAVKDLLAERFAYDDIARTMAREFLHDDGFFEIIPKNRKDEKYGRYAGKQIPADEFTSEDLLRFFAAEDEKLIKLKLNVQLFRINELFRQHFIINPDSTSLDCIFEIIDDMWTRLLHPSIEQDVKEGIRAKAEEWAAKEVITALAKDFAKEQAAPSVFVVDMSAKKDFAIVAVSGGGEFLGATAEKKPGDGRSYLTERLRQFFNRHRPAKILAAEGGAEIPPAFLKQAGDYLGCEFTVTMVKPNAKSDIRGSDYMKHRDFAMLDARATSLYCLAITYLQPITLLTRLGASYYTVHPLQDALSESKFLAAAGRVLEHARLLEGISVKDIADSPLSRFRCLPKELIAAIKTFDAAEPVEAKNDLLKVKGMTETAFSNIAGFVLIPNAEDPFDRSTLHPDQFPFLEQVVNDLTVSHETIVANPEILHSYSIDDQLQRTYTQSKIVSQIQAAQRYLGIVSQKSKKKMKLVDVKEGAVVSGKVTNITQFGVFVNINAVCDGLIHISQLADEYVETPDQVVSVGDRVDVRILKVDTKKRRISLSMKNMGNVAGMKGPKVKASKGQLDTLAEHFNKNR
ncbi:MAG: S1 RNA-binding domain-containing protein [Chitinispirillia bacterium]|nr:S1 RNA-binding domain-containing protein [Chitinispirillia bacterium]MCL2269080.1 S1 RNA-binding domain-containing protein [Chitinispirillia bacterium]